MIPLIIVAYFLIGLAHGFYMARSDYRRGEPDFYIGLTF